MAQPANLSPEFSQPMPGADAALASGWGWKAAREACDRHKRGEFYLSWQLTIDAPSSPAIRAAEAQRLAIPCGLPWGVTGPSRAPARFETEAAALAWTRHARRLLRSTLRDIAYMGFSIWQSPTAVNPTTLRREIVTIERWPLSQVRFTAVPFIDPWNPGKWIFGYYAIQFGVGESVGEVLFGQKGPTPPTGDTKGPGVAVRFIQLPKPGTTDGHWTFFGEGDMPHLNGAIVALDTAFVAGQLARRGRANLIKTLGRQAPVVILPGTTPTKSPEGDAAVKVVNGIGIDRDGAVLPGGSTMQGFQLTNPTAGLFVDDAMLNLLDVALALTGRGGALGKTDAQYQAAAELEIPEALTRADVTTIEDGASALLSLIAEQNAPLPTPIRLEGHMPDTEQEARVKARQERETREAKKLQEFWKAVAAEREQGFEFTATPDGQARLDAIAARCGVIAPRIPPEGLPPPLVKLPPATTTLEPETAVTPPEPGASAPVDAASRDGVSAPAGPS